MLSEVSSTIFWVFSKIQPGIEPRSPGPLANTLPIWSMDRSKIIYYNIFIKQKIILFAFCSISSYSSWFWFLCLMAYQMCCIVIFWFMQKYTYIYILDTHRRNDNRRMKEDAGRNEAGRKTQEDFFTNIFTSHFIARVRKGCSRVACERVLETEHKLRILTSTTYDRHVVSFLFFWCSTGGLGLILLDAGFLYCILSASSLDPSSSGLQAPSAWCGFPYHIWSLAVWNSTGNCSWTQTQLS